MDKLIVTGGNPLKGEVTVSGGKNAVLPVIAATILADNICEINSVPHLSDVDTINEVLTSLGAKVEFKDDVLTIDPRSINTYVAPYEYIQKMRASILILGPLLAKKGRAQVSAPGGCKIGSRPIDLHIKGLRALGAEIEIKDNYIEAKLEGRFKGNKIYLDFPSVGATEHIMMAAAMAEGTTIIENVAEEPEIVDLANFLNHLGANIRGAGTNMIKIEGVEHLGKQMVRHAIIPDRIEAGSYMIAAAVCGGNVLLKNVIADHIKPVIAKLQEAGAEVRDEDGNLRVIGPQKLKAADIKTLPYPGFPTDMQSPFMSLMSIAEGECHITETIFENRLMHAQQLKRMGADITIEGNVAKVKGVPKLYGAKVMATDLRAGAGLIIAGLAAEGETEIYGVHHIDRGYENLLEKFRALGANIRREEITQEEYDEVE